MRTVYAVVAVVLLSLSGGQLFGQTAQGVVTGSVVDSSGAVLPGAELTLTNQGTAVQQKDVTKNDGNYRFGLVPPGTYTLAVKAQGFTEADVKNIVVDASQTVP